MRPKRCKFAENRVKYGEACPESGTSLFYNAFQIAYINRADVHERVDWMCSARFYQIFIDRFARGNFTKDDSYIDLPWGGIPTPKSFAGGVADRLPEDAPFFVKDYFDYYKTKRGYHPRSLNSNGGWNVTSALSFLNMPILSYAGEIRSAVLVVHGEKAHSCYFSRDAFAKLKGDNKELLIIPGAVHTDLYDRTDIIPFDKIVSFLYAHLQ